MKTKLIAIIALLVVTTMTAQIDRSRQPLPGPAPTINLAAPQTFEYRNGMDVMVVENHKLPRVSISLRIENGPHAEGSKAGVGQLLSAMLGKGSLNMAKEDFNEEVDFLGARIGFGSESFFASGLSKYFDRLMELSTDAAFNPNFTQEELDTEKEKLIESLKNEAKDVGAVATRVRGVLAYGEQHPYGEYITEESIGSITLQDVIAEYNKYFVPENAYLVVVGDVDYRQVKKAVKKYFKQWQQAAPPSITVPGTQNVQYTQINFIDMPNAVQSEVMVVNTIEAKMSDPDYHARLVTNAIVGGGFDSYLNQNLREEHGWTYGARSSMGSNQYSNTTFRTSTQVRNEVTDSTVVESLKELNRIRMEDVTMDKLAQVKAKYVGDFVLALERPQTIANYALNIETNNLPDDFYQTYLEKINAVTIEDVRRIANEYIMTDNARVIVVGKASDVLEDLENIEYKGKTLPIFYYDKWGKQTDRPSMVAVPAGTTVESVFDNYMTAVGGMMEASNVNTVVWDGSASIQGQQLGVKLVKSNNGRFMQDFSMMGQSVQKQVLINGAGSMVAQGQKIPVEGEELEALTWESQVFPEMNSQGAKIAGADSVNGEEAVIVEWPNGRKSYYSIQSGLKLRDVQTQEAQGQSITIVTDYMDYKAVKGIMLPHRLMQDAGPMKLEIIMKSVMVNEGVTDADFN